MPARSNKLEATEKVQLLNKLLSDQVQKLKVFDINQLTAGVHPGWSVLEVLEHLMKAEKASLGYLNYKLSQGATFKKAGLRQKYNGFIMKRAYNSIFKFTAPEGVVPKGEYDSLDELIQDFMALRKELLDFIQNRQEEAFSLVMYKHPYFGRLTLFQMLVFFEGHFMRHSKQIDRIIGNFKLA